MPDQVHAIMAQPLVPIPSHCIQFFWGGETAIWYMPGAHTTALTPIYFAAVQFFFRGQTKHPAYDVAQVVHNICFVIYRGFCLGLRADMEQWHIWVA
jgi:hypothetical protein